MDIWAFAKIYLIVKAIDLGVKVLDGALSGIFRAHIAKKREQLGLRQPDNGRKVGFQFSDERGEEWYTVCKR